MCKGKVITVNVHHCPFWLPSCFLELSHGFQAASIDFPLQEKKILIPPSLFYHKISPHIYISKINSSKSTFPLAQLLFIATVLHFIMVCSITDVIHSARRDYIVLNQRICLARLSLFSFSLSLHSLTFVPFLRLSLSSCAHMCMRAIYLFICSLFRSFFAVYLQCNVNN